MGLNSPALKYILSRSKKYNFKGPLLTYGNQDIYADIKSLLDWAKYYKVKTPPKLNIIPTTSFGLQNINQESKNFVHAKTFFEIIGIKNNQYFDVDKFDIDNPKILHDLEKPFDKKYHNYFNLVIDSGTMEHVFDVKSVMTNTVNITKVGGNILQLIPTNNFLNHGFYQINPTFFYDFYTINGFKIVESYIIEFRPTCYRFHEYNQKKFTTFFVNPYSRLVTLFLVKKIKKVNSISTPTQYAYQQEINKKNKNLKSNIFDKYTDFLRKIIPFNLHSFLYIPWVIKNQLTLPKKYFDIPF